MRIVAKRFRECVAQRLYLGDQLVGCPRRTPDSDNRAISPLDHAPFRIGVVPCHDIAQRVRHARIRGMDWVARFDAATFAFLLIF